QLGKKQVSHAVVLAELRQYAARLLLDENVVVHVHDLFVHVHHRFSDSSDLDDVVLQPLHARVGTLAENGGAIPEVEDEQSAGREVRERRLEHRFEVGVGGLIAQHVKQ